MRPRSNLKPNSAFFFMMPPHTPCPPPPPFRCKILLSDTEKQHGTFSDEPERLPILRHPFRCKQSVTGPLQKRPLLPAKGPVPAMGGCKAPPKLGWQRWWLCFPPGLAGRGTATGCKAPGDLFSRPPSINPSVTTAAPF